MLNHDKLRDAVAREAAYRTTRDGVAAHLEAALHRVTDAKAKQHAALQKVAAGAVVDMAKLARELRDAEAVEATYTEALALAEAAADAASADVAAVLRADLDDRLAAAETAYEEAKLRFVAAATARSEAEEALGRAPRSQYFSDHDLRAMFVRELSEAELAVA